MGTETAEKKDRDHVFYSAGVNFKIVRLNREVEEFQGGRQRLVQEELSYDFGPQNGFFTLRPGQDLLPTALDGSNEDAIDYFRRSPAMNVAFWEEGQEPDRMLPTERDFLEELIAATTQQDVAKIIELRVQEVLTHGRTMLVEATGTALEQLGQDVPTPEQINAASEAQTAAEAGVSSG